MTANPTLLTMPLAQNGQKNVIPETQSTAGDGLFSQSTGFPAETSLPLGAGGVAPSREDFNGAFNLLGGVAFYAQKGWQFLYDNDQDYYAGCIVRDADDGKLYECIADMTAGTVSPHSDTANDYWTEYGVDTSAFANTDLSNLTNTGKSYIYNKNMPDYANGIVWSYTTGQTEQTYTAPSDGWLAYTITSLAGQYAYRGFVSINGQEVIKIGAQNGDSTCSGILRVNKNDTIVLLSYTDSSNEYLTNIVFYPNKEVS